MPTISIEITQLTSVAQLVLSLPQLPNVTMLQIQSPRACAELDVKSFPRIWSWCGFGKDA
jgi:hypothetical protein